MFQAPRITARHENGPDVDHAHQAGVNLSRLRGRCCRGENSEPLADDRLMSVGNQLAVRMASDEVCDFVTGNRRELRSMSAAPR
jgi:hypothetical protein